MKTDVLVIGGGIAGLRCACEAAKSAAVVLISNGGGASPYIHGINIPLHPSDSVECFYTDTLKSGKYQNDSSLVEVLCNSSTELTREFSFDKNENEYELLQPLGSSYPRVAGIEGKTGIKVMQSISENGFTHLKTVRALKLISTNGTISGAACFDVSAKKHFTIVAKAVVLACGGFGNLFPFSTNTCDIGGDGIAMAYEVGAKLCDMEFIQFEPSAAVFPKKLIGKSIITTMFYDGAVLRNGQNKQFTNELVDKDVLSVNIYREIKEGSPTPHNGVYFDMTKVPENKMLSKYKTYYDRYQSCGIDLRKTPVEIAPMPHTTLGGVKINEKCETNIAGLFACGEVSGGLHGANRLGGNAGLEVIVFGKLAGQSAARYAKQITTEKDITQEYTDTTAIATGEDRKALQSAVYSGLNVLRCAADIKQALTKVKHILEKYKNREKDYSAERLYNDSLTSYLSLSAALERTTSVGCHIRQDSVPCSFSYTIDLQKINQKLFLEKRKINEYQ